jgi:hypothetical protein
LQRAHRVQVRTNVRDAQERKRGPDHSAKSLRASADADPTIQ